MIVNEYLELGKINTLQATRRSEYGMVFSSSEKKEVLLPNRYVDEDMKVGDIVDLFLYHDSEDRIVATTQRPFAMLGEFAVMEVVDTAAYGAFVYWGIPKDLLVPKALQREPLKRGDRHLIYVDYDERTHRLVGVQKVESRFDRRSKRLKRNEEVDILPYKKTELGYKVVVNGRYEGLVFHSELFGELTIGETAIGYVKNVRDDGKVDILTRPIGKKSDEIAARKIIEYLKEHKEGMPLNYKSDPSRIEALLGLSRKNFKRALTLLVERGKIEVKQNGTFPKSERGASQ